MLYLKKIFFRNFRLKYKRDVILKKIFSVIFLAEYKGVIYLYRKKIENMKQRIRLTEGELNRIVNRSVKRVIKEGQMGTTVENLQQAHALLSDIMNSGFIPFTSPAPSSTEQELKDAIIEAARMIDKASYLCGQLGYGTFNRTLGDDPNANYV